MNFGQDFGQIHENSNWDFDHALDYVDGHFINTCNGF